MIHPDNVFYVACIASLIGFSIGTCTGCGASASTVARTTIQISAAAGNEADRLEHTAYQEQAETCLSSHEDASGYVQCMSGHEAALTALVALRGSLEAAEHIVDAVDAGAEGTVYDGLACVSLALEDVSRLLRNVGIPIPGEVDSALALLRSLILGPCGQ